jgi:bifunctional non-homologous end joining protein LigD
MQLHPEAVSEFRFIQPCNPISAKQVPAGDGKLHEPKLDGYRLQVAKDGPMVRPYSRRGYGWGKRLAALAESLRIIPTRSAILDAELCLPGRDGAPNFYGLEAAMGSGPEHELAVYAFDLLHLDGEDLRSLPLIERRRLLKRLLTRAKVPSLHLVEAFDDGQELLEAAERHGLEGVVSKRRLAPYRSGECRDWRKVKTEAWRAANRERWRLFEKS